MERTSVGAAATVFIGAIALVLGAGAAPAQAAATDPALQERVDEVLAEFPGGVQLDANTISWRDGEVILDLAQTGVAARAVGSCASGRYCAWKFANFTGDMLSFSTCSEAGLWNSLLPLGVARSYANARGSGTVKVRNGTTVVSTLAAGGSVSSLLAPTTNMICYT